MLCRGTYSEWGPMGAECHFKRLVRIMLHISDDSAASVRVCVLTSATFHFTHLRINIINCGVCKRCVYHSRWKAQPNGSGGCRTTIHYSYSDRYVLTVFGNYSTRIAQPRLGTRKTFARSLNGLPSGLVTTTQLVVFQVGMALREWGAAVIHTNLCHSDESSLHQQRG